MRFTWLIAGITVQALLASAGCAAAGRADSAATAPIESWTYQLTGYPNDKLDALAAAPHQLAVIDLARDGADDYFTRAEIKRLRATGKEVLAYFTIGTIETYRPEYRPMKSEAPQLILNRWPDWPDEYFVKYWERWWWKNVVRPRLDRAIAAGFDGAYLDTLVAYEEISLARVPGETRATLARKAAALVVRMSAYAKAKRPGFQIFPQNNPELRTQRGYTAAIDGIGMEELFYLATDVPCTQSYCAENLANARALRDAGKLILAVDYVAKPANRLSACARYNEENFAGNPTSVELDRVKPPCT